MTESTKVCSEHFTPEDFISSSSEKRKLKNSACPSVFSWTWSQTQERSLPSKWSKLQEEQEILEAEILTATVSEGEGKFDETDRDNFFSRATQVDTEVACTHRFSINILRSLCDSPQREVKYFSHCTGFKSHERFRMVLEFVLPDFNRSYVVSWDSKGENRCALTQILFLILTLKLVNHLQSQARKRIPSLMTENITVTWVWKMTFF